MKEIGVYMLPAADERRGDGVKRCTLHLEKEFQLYMNLVFASCNLLCELVLIIPCKSEYKYFLFFEVLGDCLKVWSNYAQPSSVSKCMTFYYGHNILDATDRKSVV